MSNGIEPMNNRYVKLLKPHFVQKVWGGERLSKIKNCPSLHNEDPIGESWEISIHPDGSSDLEGRPLKELLSEEEMPYLVKLIDTADYLSVQVHPPDDYAREVERSSGKTECWMILDAGEGSGIYLGMRPEVTKEGLKKAIDVGEDMTAYMQFYPVKRGDFFYIPAGTIHAIGKNIFLAEVQQSSGITYRVWDWNRVDSKGISRELHIKKALDVLNFGEELNDSSQFRYKSDLLSENESKKLVSHPQFEVELISLAKGESVILKGKDRSCSLLVLDGEFEIEDKIAEQYQSFLCSNQINIKAMKEGHVIWVF